MNSKANGASSSFIGGRPSTRGGRGRACARGSPHRRRTRGPPRARRRRGCGRSTTIEPVEPFVRAIEIVRRHQDRQPAATRSRTERRIASSVAASTPVVGSSSSSSCGSCAIARATNVRCCWPPERSEMCRFASAPQIERGDAHRRRRAGRRARNARERAQARKAPHRDDVPHVDRKAVVDVFDLWHVADRPGRERARAACEDARSSPLSGLMRPATVLSSVDFPDPLGPTMPSASPVRDDVIALERGNALVAHDELGHVDARSSQRVDDRVGIEVDHPDVVGDLRVGSHRIVVEIRDGPDPGFVARAPARAWGCTRARRRPRGRGSAAPAGRGRRCGTGWARRRRSARSPRRPAARSAPRNSRGRCGRRSACGGRRASSRSCARVRAARATSLAS